MAIDLTMKGELGRVDPTRAREFSSIHVAASASEIPSKIDLVRDRVLSVIRQQMPLETLFTAELKLDLGVFIKDQTLMFRVAQFLNHVASSESAALEKASAASGAVPMDAVSMDAVSMDAVSMDATRVATYFEGSELLGEIQAITSDPVRLSLFYAACADVLNGTVTSTLLPASLRGRVYTLKNALVAQVNPEAIRISQGQQKTPLQDIEDIRLEGAAFLRESLGLYFRLIQGVSASDSFQDELRNTAEQLLPFIGRITYKHLRAHGKELPENPLIFRNPSGYNHHGLVAATVLDACLKVLGYDSRLMVRSDLEPKVTLATVHSIVRVIDKEGIQYVVDPTYLQFHKDICVDEGMLPRDPILVLAESEVDRYIEATIMSHWRSTFTLYSAGDTATCNALVRQDQIIAYAIRDMGLPAQLVPVDVSTWVKSAIKRVWALEGYQAPLSNASLQEIFHGVSERKSVYELVKPMGIASLTGALSQNDIEGRLSILVQNEELRGKNTFESLNLISQLPKRDRVRFAGLLDCDMRLQRAEAMEMSLSAYFRSLRKMVNPEGRDLQVIYGCSGADCTTVLLATDAQDITFFDMTPLAYKDFQEAFELLTSENPLVKMMVRARINEQNFLMTRSRYAGASSCFDGQGKHEMPELALKLFFSLRELGVNLSEVVVRSIEEGSGIQVDFPWAYFEGSAKRKRTLTLLTGDVTQVDSYPDLLKAKLDVGIDVFYMKAAFFVPLKYPDFLPYIANSLRSGGWLMTADKTFTMEAVNPTPCLEGAGLRFIKRSNEETERFKELIDPPYDPMLGTSVLDMFPSDRRPFRTPGSDLSYWAKLTLRQKEGALILAEAAT